MKIEFVVKNEYNIYEKDYIDKPIIKDEKPIGVIINAIKEVDTIKIEGILFEKFINLYVDVYKDDNDEFRCGGIELF